MHLVFFLFVFWLGRLVLGFGVGRVGDFFFPLVVGCFPFLISRCELCGPSSLGSKGLICFLQSVDRYAAVRVLISESESSIASTSRVT